MTRRRPARVTGALAGADCPDRSRSSSSSIWLASAACPSVLASAMASRPVRSASSTRPTSPYAMRERPQHFGIPPARELGRTLGQVERLRRAPQQDVRTGGQRMSEVGERHDRFRLTRQRLAIVRDGLVHTPVRHAGDREVVVGVGIVRPECQRRAVARHGLLSPAGPEEREPEVVVCLRVARVDLERATVVGRPPRPMRRPAAARWRGCSPPARTADRCPARSGTAACFVCLAGAEQRVAEVVVCDHVVGGAGDRLPVTYDRVLAPSRRARALARPSAALAWPGSTFNARR